MESVFTSVITISEVDRCCCRYLCVQHLPSIRQWAPKAKKMPPPPYPGPGLWNSPPRHSIDSWKRASKLPCIPWLFLVGDIYHRVLTAPLQHKQWLGPRRAVFILSGSYCLEPIPSRTHAVCTRLGRWSSGSRRVLVDAEARLHKYQLFFSNGSCRILSKMMNRIL